MTVLIADDDRNIVAAATLLFSSENIDSVGVASPAEALEALDKASIDLALIDLNYCQDTTSGMEGLELISALREKDADLPIVVMTGWGTINLAVEAMRRGAADFIEKPWDNNRLLAIVRSQSALRMSRQREQRLIAENRLLRQQVTPSPSIVAVSTAMQELLSVAARVAGSDIPILITGENGTGKTLLAQHIHQQSARVRGPLLSVNMGGIAENIFESEMFGHTKGAFTDARSERIGRVEMAESGTLFLDEIGNTPLSQQAKLLRLLEEHCFEKLGSSRVQKADVRIVSATNANLDQLIEQQGFRQDLLYRLNGVTLHIPPLRERVADIAPLAQKFLESAINRFDTPARAFSASTVALLVDYSWPGNIRELHHVVERAVLLASQEEIVPGDLQLYPGAGGNGAATNGETVALTKMTLDDAERWLIKQALDKQQGNAEDTARALGVSRSGLYRRLEKYGLSR